METKARVLASDESAAERAPCSPSVLDEEHKPALYRCYLLDASDRINSFIELQAASDAEAIAQASRYAQLVRKPFELWRGHEMVCTRSGGRRP